MTMATKGMDEKPPSMTPARCFLEGKGRGYVVYETVQPARLAQDCTVYAGPSFARAMCDLVKASSDLISLLALGHSRRGLLIWRRSHLLREEC